jgi:hypothetical protein
MTFLITVESLPRQVDGLERARTIPNELRARFDLQLDPRATASNPARYKAASSTPASL